MSAVTPETADPRAVAPLRRPSRRLSERVVLALLLLCGIVSILTTTGIVLALLQGTIEFFAEVSPIDFLTGTVWQPVANRFGVLPLISNTLEVVFFAGLIGLPIGLACAIYLSEYASDRSRRILKPTLELLAGIPSVVFGFFALKFVTPELLRPFLGKENVTIFNALSAAIVIAFMIVPLVASISEDALRSVPNGLREGAYGLGATRMHVATRVVVPAALSGIAASFVLAVSRVIGETMVLAVAAGSKPVLAWHPLEQIQTMASYIANVAGGDIATGTIRYKTVFTVGMTLFVITLLMNMLATWLVRRFRREY